MQINQLINLHFCAMALMSSGRDLELGADAALRTPGGALHDGRHKQWDAPEGFGQPSGLIKMFF